jgi:hypothetical protein
MFEPHHQAVADRLDTAAVTAARAPRLKSSALRESLARLCSPLAIELGPGERITAGRVFYSAAWLSPPHVATPLLEHLSALGVEHSRLESVSMAVDRPRLSGGHARG